MSKIPDGTKALSSPPPRELGLDAPSHGKSGAVKGMLTIAPQSPLKAIEQDLKKLMVDLAESQGRYEEFKNSSHKEMKHFLKELLEVTDAFDRIFANLEERADSLEVQTKRLAGNFRTIRILLEQALSKVGILPLEVVLGSPALPERHQIVETRVATDMEEGGILEVALPGYYWRDEILRFPQVVVAKNAKEESRG